MTKKKYKRKYLIIDPAFQIRTTAIICATTAIFFILLDIVIISATKSHLLAMNLPPGSFEPFLRKLIIFQIIILLLFICIQFFGLLMFTHKIAGPMVKVKNILRNTLSGTKNTNTRFRDGDFFFDVAELITAVDQRLLERDEEVNKLTKQIDQVFNKLPSDLQDEGHIIKNQVQKLKIFDKI